MGDSYTEQLVRQKASKEILMRKVLLIVGVVVLFFIYALISKGNTPFLMYCLKFIYMFILFGYFNKLPSSVIDQKVIRGYRDIMLITLGFQYLIIIIMFIRALGFDIKKFNFTKDIQELNLTQEDAEEIEVDVNVDTNVLMREVRKQKREFGYFFKEYKVFILGIIFVLMIVLGVFGYNYFSKKFKVYNQNEVVGYLNKRFESNSFYHPQYLMGWGKNKPQSQYLLNAFCQNTQNPE